MEPNPLLLTAARVALIYFCLLFCLRLLAKRSLGLMPAGDMLVLLIVGESADDLVLATLPAWKGALIVGSVAFWHLAHLWAMQQPVQSEAAPAPGPVALSYQMAENDGRLALEAQPAYVARSTTGRGEPGSAPVEGGPPNPIT